MATQTFSPMVTINIKEVHIKMLLDNKKIGILSCIINSITLVFLFNKVVLSTLVLCKFSPLLFKINHDQSTSKSGVYSHVKSLLYLQGIFLCSWGCRSPRAVFSSVCCGLYRWFHLQHKPQGSNTFSGCIAMVLLCSWETAEFSWCLREQRPLKGTYFFPYAQKTEVRTERLWRKSMYQSFLSVASEGLHS